MFDIEWSGEREVSLREWKREIGIKTHSSPFYFKFSSNQVDIVVGNHYSDIIISTLYPL